MRTLTEADIQFEPYDSIMFIEDNNIGCSVINEYLWATPALVERAGFTKELSDLVEERFGVNILEDSEFLTDFYFNEVVRDNYYEQGLDSKVEDKYVECIYSYPDLEVQDYIEELIGFASPILNLSTEELDLIHNKVKANFEEINGTSYESFKDDCLKDLESEIEL